LGASCSCRPDWLSNPRPDRQRSRQPFARRKSFQIGERIKTKFRVDSFNALNEPVLRGPDANPISSTFGRITAQEPSRSFQASLNVQF